jgi:hypothetical protein
MYKKVFILISVFLLLLIVGTFFIPYKQKFTISKEINFSEDRIYQQVSNISSWKNWFYWLKLDKDAQIEFKTTANKNTIYTWVSTEPNVGEGILRINKNSGTQDFELFFGSTEWGIHNTSIEIEEKGANNAQVTIKVERKTKNYMEKVATFLFFYTKIKPAYKKSLSDLEIYLSKG